MTLPAPGPVSVDEAVGTGQYTSISELWNRRDWFVQKHSAHKARIREATYVVNGEWGVVWPDLSRTPEAPSVANMVELGINHWASIGGAMIPSIKVPVNVTEDRSQGKRGARKRERRVRELWESSNISELAALLWGDYAGAGTAVLGAWVNFDEPNAAKRNPYLVRYDPRFTYVTKDNIGNVTEMLVARAISKAELSLMLPPEYDSMFAKSPDEEIEEWFWYQRDRFYHIVVDVSKEGRTKQRYAVLVDEENTLGFIPAWEVVRPTFDGQRRGIFDQTLHILHTMHKLMTMTIYSAMEHSFPAVLEYDVVNAGEFGPGTILHARSAESKFERVSPGSHFDVKDLIARLAEDANKQATYPQQLSGEPGASIVSATGINASMGALDARLALAHRQFEIGFGKASGYLLAMDETFCNGVKQIHGDQRDTKAAEEFNPERDIAGSWVVACTYGIGAGSDPANVELRLSMHLANRLISRESARRQLTFLDDEDKEPILMLREQMQDALVMGVTAMATQGDPSLAAKALQLLRKDDVDLDEIVEKLSDLLAPPEQTTPTALGNAQGAESLARGGVPGNAEQGFPAQGLGLPGLGDMMNQDARLVV